MATEYEIRQNIVATTTDVAEYLYNNHAPHEPWEYKSIDLGKELDMTHPMTEDRCVELQHLGILTRTVNYGRYLPDGTWKIGRFAMWELQVSRKEALSRIREWGERLLAGELVTIGAQKAAKKERQKAALMKDMTDARNQPTVAPGGPVERRPATVATETVDNTVTVTTSPVEDTKAIAGPEAPTPLAALAPLRKADDAGALIAAARQYASRTIKVREQVASLAKMAKDLGIEVDESAVMLGVHLIPDDRLETIALVLPVIDRLEATVERLSAQNSELRERVKTVDATTVENRRLKTRVEQLISERVQQRQQHTQA